jgi:hypothetical protein
VRATILTLKFAILGAQRDCIAVDIMPSEALYFAFPHVGDADGEDEVLRVLGKMRDDASDFDFGKEPCSCIARLTQVLNMIGPKVKCLRSIPTLCSGD